MKLMIHKVKMKHVNDIDDDSDISRALSAVLNLNLFVKRIRTIKPSNASF